MKKNHSIKCDVKKCAHNSDGCFCCLDCVKITCDGKNKETCCDDFSEK